MTVRIDYAAWTRWRETLGEAYAAFPIQFDRNEPVTLDASLVRGYLARAGYVGVRQGVWAAVVPERVVK